MRPHPPSHPSMPHAYLHVLLPPVIGASPEELKYLFDDKFKECMAKFAAEGSAVCHQDGDHGEGACSSAAASPSSLNALQMNSSMYSYCFMDHLTCKPVHVTLFALIKRMPTFDPITSLATQLHSEHLQRRRYAVKRLHAIVSCGVKPWFDVFAGTRDGGNDNDMKSFITSRDC